MKINVELLGLPMVSDIVGKEKFELDIPGKTVKDAIAELIRRYGKTVRNAFFDKEGNYDLLIQIVLNRKSFITADKYDTLLNEGDSLIFMMLLTGG
jgi:molybdopterin converting factor small subunit